MVAGILHWLELLINCPFAGFIENRVHTMGLHLQSVGGERDRRKSRFENCDSNSMLVAWCVGL